MSTEHGERGPQGEAVAANVAMRIELPGAVYEALAAVAHDEGHSVSEQVVRAVQEMLNERKRRPLFD